MTKHTPGPWELHEQPVEVRTGEGLDFSIMQSEPLRCLILLAAPGHVTPEFIANAHLIAAAPDMLTALELACSTAEYLANWDKPPQSKWYYTAKSAITKAVGAIPNG